ncbi:MAG: hypothetical protein Q8J74_12350 [Candidatus Didemnitutus sp.]|nr:hypothetical protein [Candidatus Didemnitutus sp.]
MTTLNHPEQKTRPWTREQIRDARMADLAKLLEKRGHRLVETGGGNCLVPAFPGLIVKASYWRWPERNSSGNAIDFLVQVLGRSFHDTMTEITTP